MFFFLNQRKMVENGWMTKLMINIVTKSQGYAQILHILNKPGRKQIMKYTMLYFDTAVL